METKGVKIDRWGYQVKTSSDDCISAINTYYEQFLTYGRDRSVILKALDHDEHCVLAIVLAAHFVSSSNHSKAQALLASSKAQLQHGTSYEKAVFEAISCLISPDRDDDVAAELHFKLLKQFPRDLASLKRAQLLCFYMGHPQLSLDFVEQVLPQNQQENYIYGMLAFPLLELGRMGDAEKAARKGLEINKHDLWSQHNLCHVFQYECQYKEAVEFMEKCSSSWSFCSSFMYTHNWWHVAVCYLDGNSPIAKVLKVYDDCIWKELERSDASAPEVYLNALALLMRVYTRGQIDVFEDRLKILVERVMDQSIWHIEWHLDLLILWALTSAGRVATAEDLLKALKSRVYSMSRKKQQFMQRGLMLAEGVYEYSRGNYEQAYEVLGPDFDARDYKMIGASDEQLDVFNEVWYSVLLNSGRSLKAIEVVEKRIKREEGIPFLWRLLEKGYLMSGRDDVMDVSVKAGALEAAYFEHS